jgi:hypothetical protein
MHPPPPIEIDVESTCLDSNPFEYNLSNSSKFTFKNVMAQIITEEDAIQFCINVGLINKSFDCPKCSNPMHQSVKTGKGAKVTARWRCGRKTCNVERSMRTGSFFQGSKLKWTTLISLLWSWSAREPVTTAAQKAECTLKSAIDWYQFCRDVCSKELGSISLKVTAICLLITVCCYLMWYTCFFGSVRIDRGTGSDRGD